MHDPEAPPRLRWRLALWGIAVLILTPVLYVAASGPLAWWDVNSYRLSYWRTDYAKSLEPLDRHPQIGSMLNRYRIWWVQRPAPRSWKRQHLADVLAERRTHLARLRAERAQWEAEAAELRLHLQALDAQPRHSPEHQNEAIDVRNELDWLLGALGDGGQELTAHSPSKIERIEAEVQLAEQRLRQFDAQ
jgi:hypothetical protein